MFIRHALWILQAKKCNFRKIERIEKEDLFDKIFSWLLYDYECKSCGYKWDADSPNDGSDPNNTSDSSDDGVVICDVPPIF